MGFKIVSGLSEKIYAGQIIQYIVTPILGIPTKWVTEITMLKMVIILLMNNVSTMCLWHHKRFIKPIERG